MLYHAIMIFNAVDIAPRSSSEIFYVAIIILLSSIYNAIIYGQFVVLVEEISRNSVEMEDNFDISNTTMVSLKLTKSLRTEIRSYIR